MENSCGVLVALLTRYHAITRSRASMSGVLCGVSPSRALAEAAAPEKFSVPKFHSARARCYESNGHRRGFNRPGSRRRKPAFGRPSHVDRGGKGPLLHCAEQPYSVDQCLFGICNVRKGLNGPTSAVRASGRWLQKESKTIISHVHVENMRILTACKTEAL